MKKYKKSSLGLKNLGLTEKQEVEGGLSSVSFKKELGGSKNGYIMPQSE